MEHVLLVDEDFSGVVLVGLPGAHLNLRVVAVAEVDEQEEVALVLITVGVPVLFEGHAVDVVIFGMLNNLDVLKLDIQVFGHLEYACQFLQILLFRLLDIDHLVVVEGHAVDVRVGFLFHHLAGDDECLVAVDAVEHGQVFAVVGGAEVLYKVDDNLSAGIIQIRLFLGHNLVVAVHGDGDGHIVDFSVGLEVDGQFLSCFLVVGLNHIHGDASHLESAGGLQASGHDVGGRTAHGTALPYFLHSLDGFACHPLLVQFDVFFLLIGSSLECLNHAIDVFLHDFFQGVVVESFYNFEFRFIGCCRVCVAKHEKGQCDEMTDNTFHSFSLYNIWCIY